MTPCTVCDAPHTTPAQLCPKCATGLTDALAALPHLVDQLDLNLTRQAKARPSRNAAPREDKRLPFNLGASAMLDTIRGVLTDWARLVVDERTTREPLLDDDGQPVLTPEGAPTWVELPTPHPGTDQPGDLARWLYRYSHWLAAHDAAPDAHRELTGLVAEALDAIDIHPDPEFLGVCRAPDEAGAVCRARVYAHTDEGSVACPRCGALKNARSLRAQALDMAEDELLPRRVLTRALRRHGEPIGEHDVKTWHKRGLLEPAGWDQRGRCHLYRLGDVRDLLAVMEARYAARLATATARAAA